MGKMRDRIRAATVGKTPEPNSEIVEIEEGVEVEVRAMKFKERMRVRKQCITQVHDQEKGEIRQELDQHAFELHLLLNTCFDPEDGEPVFELGDFPTFDEQPGSGDDWFSRLREVADRVNTPGNSKATQSD